MGTFGMDTGTVDTLGGKINDQAAEFGYNHKKISDIVDGLVNSNYTSDDAIAIAESIRGYDPELNAMEAKLAGHGDFAIMASRTTAATNDEIKSSIARNL